MRTQRAARKQEKTLASALKSAGYVTGHFGKWHLDGFSGPGVPLLASDEHQPGKFGFDEWVSVSNFYDVDPLMSREGRIEQFYGDSSEIVVNEAVKFLEKHRGSSQPMFAAIWYGSPHSPFKALPADKAAFGQLDEASANQYGELAAMDRSLGTLRKKLRELGLAENTLLVFAVIMAACRILLLPALAICAVSKARSSKAACACREFSSGPASSNPGLQPIQPARWISFHGRRCSWLARERYDEARGRHQLETAVQRGSR